MNRRQREKQAKNPSYIYKFKKLQRQMKKEGYCKIECGNIPNLVITDEAKEAYALIMNLALKASGL